MDRVEMNSPRVLARSLHAARTISHAAVRDQPGWEPPLTGSRSDNGCSGYAHLSHVGGSSTGNVAGPFGASLKGAGQDAIVGQVDFKVVVRHASDGLSGTCAYVAEIESQAVRRPYRWSDDGYRDHTVRGRGSERWLTVKCGDLIQGPAELVGPTSRQLPTDRCLGNANSHLAEGRLLADTQGRRAGSPGRATPESSPVERSTVSRRCTREWRRASVEA